MITEKSKNKKDQKELTEALSDLEYWKDIAKRIGMVVSGWSNKSSALFTDKESNQSINIPGWMGKCILNNTDDPWVDIEENGLPIKPGNYLCHILNREMAVQNYLVL